VGYQTTVGSREAENRPKMPKKAGFEPQKPPFSMFVFRQNGHIFSQKLPIFSPKSTKMQEKWH
jgi:hypothetical protein